MLERNFKLILLELQIILEKGKDKSLSERDRGKLEIGWRE
jgi:hypothetical protein